MISVVVLQVYSLAALTSWSASASIVPCTSLNKPLVALQTNLADKFVQECGFGAPNGTAKPQLSQKFNRNQCSDLGFFEGTKQGTQFKDPCKPNVTIDKIELTVSKAPVMIRSLKTTYSDGSVYSHGTPTDEVYTIDLTVYNPRVYIIASIVDYSDVVYRITFIAVDHLVAKFCYFGPIGGDDGDWRIEVSPVNAFYGSADEGITGIGFYGCLLSPPSNKSNKHVLVP